MKVRTKIETDDPAYMERFLSHVEKTESCGHWTGYRSGRAGHLYGRVNFRGESRLAHRVAWTLFYGEISTRLMVCHHCDVPHCVNPDHLFLGSQATNIHDMHAKGRARTGVAIRRDDGLPSRAKLTKDQIEKIKTLRESGLAQHRIASIIGVSQGCISQLLRGATNYAK